MLQTPLGSRKVQQCKSGKWRHLRWKGSLKDKCRRRAESCNNRIMEKRTNRVFRSHEGSGSYCVWIILSFSLHLEKPLFKNQCFFLNEMKNKLISTQGGGMRSGSAGGQNLISCQCWKALLWKWDFKMLLDGFQLVWDAETGDFCQLAESPFSLLMRRLVAASTFSRLEPPQKKRIPSPKVLHAEAGLQSSTTWTLWPSPEPSSMILNLPSSWWPTTRLQLLSGPGWFSAATLGGCSPAGRGQAAFSCGEKKVFYRIKNVFFF